MKKIKFVFLIVLVLLVLSSASVFAKGDTKLYIDGKEVKTDVSPEIVNNRVMVPVRSIFEELGADVTWIGSRKQVIVKSISTRIVLNVDKTKAYVDDKAFELDVAPMIINGRTVIPVRFVSETLGYDVIWDSKTNSVHINKPVVVEKEPLIQKITITEQSESSKVVVSVKDMKRPKISYADEPTRFIADFPNATISGGDSRKRLNTDDITEVRYAEHEEYARVVIETPGESTFNVRYTSDSMIVTVTTEKSSDHEDDSKEEKDENDQEYEDEDDIPDIERPEFKVPEIDIDNPIIVLDPGHGGWDSGAVAVDEDGDVIVNEADANLAIALSAQKYLEAEGITVVMTRTSDVALGTTEMEDLLARSEIANEVGATFFVSVHNNSFSNDTASGTEILYVSGGIENVYGISGENLAQNILTPLVQATGLTNRGLKNSPKIVVLRETLMPAVLVECAFVSNPQDRELLIDKQALDDMGYAIAIGIMETISQCK